MTGSTTSASSRSRLNACRTQPSKAKPKTTLFGSNLEKIDPETMLRTERMDLDVVEESLKPRMQVRNPPPVLAAEIKDCSKLVSAREELEIRKRNFDSAHRNLDRLEKHVLFHPGDMASDVPGPGDHEIPDKPHQWMKPGDLANASSINVLGVNPRKLPPNETYNRDKYGPRPPVHEYQLHGDLLNKGEVRQQKNSAKSSKNASQIEQNSIDEKMYVSNYKTSYGRQRQDQNGGDFAGVDLPKNIEHMFGTRVCQVLLSDKEKVTLTLEEEAKRRAQYRKERGSSVDAEKKKVEFSMYEDLGNALRHDHFPGFSTDNQSTTTKDVYTTDVHEKHVPGPDQWRYQRDELNNWLDAIIIQDRVKKVPVTSTSVVQERPRPPPKPVKERPPPRPRKASSHAPAEEHVRFETPPKTPEKRRALPEDLAQLPAGAEKDKEFWDYYDKGGKQ